MSIQLFTSLFEAENHAKPWIQWPEKPFERPHVLQFQLHTVQEPHLAAKREES